MIFKSEEKCRTSCEVQGYGRLTATTGEVSISQYSWYMVETTSGILVESTSLDITSGTRHTAYVVETFP